MDCFNRFTTPALQLEKYFDDIVNSYNEKQLKDDNHGEQILKIMTQERSIAKDCILIDDSKKTCKVFESLGGQAYLITKENDVDVHLSILDSNKGIYADKHVADEWIAWTKKFRPDEVRATDVYPHLSKWLKKIKPKRILEIGSGSGLCSEEVDLGNVNYVGIEPSLHLREYAIESYPNRDFRFGTAEEIPFENNAFDAVFSVFVWFHLADLDVAAKELSRVLVSGGSFVIITANPATYGLWKSWHTNAQIKGKELVGDMKHLPKHQMFLHTADEFNKSFVNNGLVVDEVVDYGFDAKVQGPGFTVIFSGHKI
jgi:SAM-dependent methyltransferase